MCLKSKKSSREDGIILDHILHFSKRHDHDVFLERYVLLQKVSEKVFLFALFVGCFTNHKMSSRAVRTFAGFSGRERYHLLTHTTCRTHWRASFPALFFLDSTTEIYSRLAQLGLDTSLYEIQSHNLTTLLCHLSFVRFIASKLFMTLNIFCF